MNLRNISRVFSAFFLGTLLIFTSCNSNEELTTSEQELTTSEVENIVVTDDVSSEIEEVLEDDNLDVGLSNKGTSASSVADCVTRTAEASNEKITVVLDFGDGCETKRGKVLAGKLTIVYVKLTDGYSKTVTFDGFSVNGNSVVGEMAVERIKENNNGNPQSTITLNISVTLNNGVIVSRKGTKIREKVEGVATKERGDDVFSITGNWESVKRNGVVRKAEVTTPLIRKYACKFIVSGVVEISKDDKVYSLDFGIGECDNKAVLTNSEGNSREISLRHK